MYSAVVDFFNKHLGSDVRSLLELTPAVHEEATAVAAAAIASAANFSLAGSNQVITGDSGAMQRF